MEILFRASEVVMNIFPPLHVFCRSLAHWGGGAATLPQTTHCAMQVTGYDDRKRKKCDRCQKNQANYGGVVTPGEGKQKPESPRKIRMVSKYVRNILANVQNHRKP